ncbi:TPA: hypothetical protein DDZ86_01950 [Candidatus Dependentiae bacterium]|nr:MAG: hypothetical protein UW09_C0001G0248 [candidate division TM6 bacterium GW2011_GWF2_43_87]HBL98387.1 hypothetical protein [Candidatus Dependentiae bacterium]
MKRLVFALALLVSPVAMSAHVEGVREALNQLRSTGANREALELRIAEARQAGDISQEEAAALLVELAS